MALNPAQATLKAAAITYLQAWETYIDTLSAGDEIRVCGLDVGDSALGDRLRTASAANATATGDKVCGLRHIEDGETVLQIPNPGWQIIPLAYFATNANNDTDGE
jgi:hypothetical protein